MARPLLVVDVQQGFVNDYTAHIPDRIVRFIERNRPRPILFTRFVNREDGPYARFLDWHACEAPPETDLAPVLLPYVETGSMFVKPGLAGLSEELRGYLKTSSFEAIDLVGIDTDMCVLKIALDIFDLGIEPLVYTDCCASTAGLQAHLAGLAVLARNIGADRLRDAGMNVGHLAAPDTGR
jgi:nicotinamidase-related amidase